MQTPFVPGQAIVEASLCVLQSNSITLSVLIERGQLCFLLRKCDSKSVLVIHYDRVSRLQVISQILSS